MTLSTWRACKLGDIVTLKRGYDLPRQERRSGPFPLVSSSGITDHIDEAKVKGPGVITGRYGTLGDVFYLEADYWPLNTTLYVQDFQGNDPRFISYLLKHLNFGTRNAAGAVPGVNRNHLHTIDVRVPPVALQRRIVGILSIYDGLIENDLRRIQILDEIARSTYREWVVDFRFPGHEDVATPTGPVPNGWDVRPLGAIARDVRRNVSKGPLDDPRPYVGLEHIPRRSLALDAWETTADLGSNKLEFKKGDVLFGKIRPYFHKVAVAPFDGLCSADTIVIRATLPEHHAVMTACVSSDDFVAQATATSNGSKMPRANWGVLQNYPVTIPRGAPAARFSGLFSDVIAQQQTLVLRTINVRRTRDLLLPRLLSGQLSVGGAA